MFSIKKCGDPSCVCKPPRLPRVEFDSLHHLPDPVPDGDRYKTFECLYGSKTTEEHRPSLGESKGKGAGMPFTPTAQYANNVTLVLQCHECEKWRLIYSNNRLSPQERSELSLILESVQYSCGSALQDIIEHNDGSVLQKVFTRTNLTCLSSIEIPYYSTNAHETLCFHCGSKETIKYTMILKTNTQSV